MRRTKEAAAQAGVVPRMKPGVVRTYEEDAGFLVQTDQNYCTLATGFVPNMRVAAHMRGSS